MVSWTQMTTASHRQVGHASTSPTDSAVPFHADACRQSSMTWMWHVLVHPASEGYCVNHALGHVLVIMRAAELWLIAACRSPLSVHQPADCYNSLCNSWQIPGLPLVPSQLCYHRVQSCLIRQLIKRSGLGIGFVAGICNLHTCLHLMYMYCIVTFQPFGCNTLINIRSECWLLETSVYAMGADRLGTLKWWINHSMMRAACCVASKVNSLNSVVITYNAVGQLWCTVCNCPIKTNLLWNSHIQGRTHREVFINRLSH